MATAGGALLSSIPGEQGKELLVAAGSACDGRQHVPLRGKPLSCDALTDAGNDFLVNSGIPYNTARGYLQVIVLMFDVYVQCNVERGQQLVGPAFTLQVFALK